jgi:hypothetical protein
LEVLRKGKTRPTSGTASKDTKKDSRLKQKGKSRYVKGPRGHRKRPKYHNYEDEDNTSYGDNTLPIVCINQLAEELNTEENIRKSFGLDSDGRLPKEVVTIDDDDDDEDGTQKKDARKFAEKDLAFLSFIRLKPNKLTKSEDELFERKLKENDANRGMDAISSHANSAAAAAGREKRSLNSVVAMLRSTSSSKAPSSRSHLLEQYKQNKAKTKQDHKLSGKENADSQQSHTPSFIDLSQDTGSNDVIHATAAGGGSHLKPGSSVNIPGKGEYQIVEEIVTKQGDKKKYILKLGKPMGNAVPGGGLEHVTGVAPPGVAPHPASAVGTSVVNSANDLYSVTNMVRTHPGLNEIMKRGCHKVRGLCKDLPKNPLLWTKRHVAMFIQNADFKKYAKRFFDQEVDGHSLLLLTAWEIHHILGIQLGPAMKIHDYVFSLQQLVNDAYLKSKTKVLLQAKPPNTT